MMVPRCLEKTVKLACCVAVGLMAGCLDLPEPTVDSAESVGGDDSPLSQDQYKIIAKAVAVTLERPGFRHEMLSYMASSIYDRGAVPFAQIKESRVGREIEARLVEWSLTSDEIGTLFADLYFVMPSTLDRSNWRGSDDIVVVGVSQDWLVRNWGGVVMGYDVQGNVVEMDREQRVFDFPVLMVTDGAKGLADLAASAGGATAYYVGNGESTDWWKHRRVMRGKGQYITPSPGEGPQVDLGFSIRDCFGDLDDSVPDVDNDDMADSCEVAIARAFFPHMKVDPRDSLRREEYWEVRPLIRDIYGDTAAAVFYGFGYYVDLGKPEWYNFNAHWGDSEFLVMSIHNGFRGPLVGSTDYEKWGVDMVCFSAHWGEAWGIDSSECVSARWLDYGDSVHPITWVAYRKHANYKSKGSCGAGGFLWNDTCTNNTHWNFFEVVDTARFSDTKGLGQGKGWDSRKGELGTEWHWGNRPSFWPEGRLARFCGWQNVRWENVKDCSSYYGGKLRNYGFKPAETLPGWTTPASGVLHMRGPTVVKSDMECTWTVGYVGFHDPKIRWEGVFGDTVTVGRGPWRGQASITGIVKESGGLWASIYPAYRGSSPSDSIRIRVDDEEPMIECEGQDPL